MQTEVTYIQQVQQQCEIESPESDISNIMSTS